MSETTQILNEPIATNEAEEIIEAQKPTKEELFFVDLALQAFAGTIPRLNDYLSKIIVLDTALIGGSIFWLTSETMRPFFRLAVVCTFIASLVLACLGLYPIGGNVPTRRPYAIRNFHLAIMQRKISWLQWSVGLLLAGFTIAVIGMINKAI
jgi:hypothetical protein